MTSRIGKPDTDADRELRGCLDAKTLTSFVMIAGAGSGKTTSLVKALDHISKTRGNDLKRQGRKVACITYTEVAEREIWGDVGHSPLFHVSTIHSFLWTVIQPFQSDIRRWLEGRIDKKVADLEAKLANPRTRQATRESATQDIQRYRKQRAVILSVRRFRYGTGSDYAEGVLGHSDILVMVPELINERPLLRTLVAQKFPYTFVDESQDTVPEVVKALKAIDADESTSFCLGFFGDPMQKIYPSGIGDISVAAGWQTIKKGENFRCSQKVLDVVNNIRRPADGLKQKPGKPFNPHKAAKSEGTARIFILPADDCRTERVRAVREWLAKSNDDEGWLNDDDEEELRILVIVHRMAAKRLGFPNLYAALNDENPPSSLKDGFLDGTAWAVRPFVTQLLPLVVASKEKRDFEVMRLLRLNAPALDTERLRCSNVQEELQKMKMGVDRLAVALDEASETSIGDVLQIVKEFGIADLDGPLGQHLVQFGSDVEPDVGGDGVDDGDARERRTMRAFFSTPARQLWGYRTYIEDVSPFATQQGIKGAEFKRVISILDDGEGTHTHFSYNKFFGIAELSDTDKDNIQQGKDNVIDRTRRLFYVCCSRAKLDLAVIFFVEDVVVAKEKVLASEIFPETDVHVFE